MSKRCGAYGSANGGTLNDYRMAIPCRAVFKTEGVETKVDRD